MDCDGILGYVLKERRWRVDYGLDPAEVVGCTISCEGMLYQSSGRRSLTMNAGCAQPESRVWSPGRPLSH